MRTLALLAVVTAHAEYLSTGSLFLDRLIASFSDSGVAVFFFAAGAYWRWKPWILTVKHTGKLLPPWIVLGTLVYTITAFTNGFSFSGWFYWLLGKDTYLWYLSIYVIIQITFSLLKIEQRKSLIACVLITAVSRVMIAYFGISGHQAFLNPLNWGGFFAAGVYFRQKIDSKQDFYKYVCKWYLLIAIIAIVVFAYLDALMPTVRLDYWAYFDCFSQLSWIVVFFYISCALASLHGYEIGKVSLTIYLLHIPVIGFVTSRIIVGMPLIMLICIAVIVGLYLFLYLAKKVAFICKLDKLFKLVTGF